MDIIVKNLCKTYDRNQVLDHFSCTFREKKMTCIMGKSGIGKSTLLLQAVSYTHLTLPTIA